MMKSRKNVKTKFFIIGTQKSGTTILARLLDQHPEIACIWEAYFLNPKIEKSVLNSDSDAYLKHGFEIEDVHRWFDRVKHSNPYSLISRVTRKLSGQYNFNFDPYRDVINEVLDCFAENCNASVVGDKWPWYIDFISYMIRAFPDARFVHTVRDPRGLWNSAQNFKNRKRGDEILNEMLAKNKAIESHLSKDNFLTVRYEDLINTPEESCSKLYGFLGCDYKKEYLDYRVENDPFPERWNWIPEASGNLDSSITIKWKDQMTLDQINSVECRSKWFMEKYNYC